MNSAGVEYVASDGVAVITLAGVTGTLDWGTKIEEHRINMLTVDGLNAALDKALADETVQVTCYHLIVAEI
jgi:hypothetical protein